ncbi:MAG: hypothetical protein J5613_04785 [Alphaproteobacteria bacterium]|nr:hypothetical protein [Alphaproteobacteria bacterium]
MVIIAFAPKSSKILPNIFCKKFKHCAVIVKNRNEFLMYQFISRNHIDIIKIKLRDIRILGQHGWRFVYIPCNIPCVFPIKTWTCVNLAKYAIGLRAPFVQTPDALYKRIYD